MRNYGNRLEKYLICISSYKIKNYQCGLAKYNKKKEKICTYIILKYANYSKTYITNFLHYILKHQIDIKVKREKKTKEKEKEKMQAKNVSNKVKKKEKTSACS